MIVNKSKRKEILFFDFSDTYIHVVCLFLNFKMKTIDDNFL